VSVDLIKSPNKKDQQEIDPDREFKELLEKEKQTKVEHLPMLRPAD